MYSGQIAKAFFIPIGALICWLFKGFKGGYFDQDTDENESTNFWVGILTIIVIVFIVGVIKNI